MPAASFNEVIEMNTSRLTIHRLCLSWNCVTNPKAYRTNAGHRAANKAARKIMTILKNHPDYSRVSEFSNGCLYVK